MNYIKNINQINQINQIKQKEINKTNNIIKKAISHDIEFESLLNMIEPLQCQALNCKKNATIGIEEIEFCPEHANLFLNNIIKKE
jgi:hypothetical protein